MLTAAQLTQRFKLNAVTVDNAFETLQILCAFASGAQGVDEKQAQDLVIRALDQREIFSSYSEVLNGLTRHFGLFPYLPTNDLNVKDAMAREYHRPSLFRENFEINIPSGFRGDERGVIFHRLQADVFRRILDGDSIVLSAPTSFGKSSLVDALVEDGRFINIAIVVPTIALIDETRRRLSKFKRNYKIITHASQAIEHKNIFILTQERAIDFPAMPALDLFVLDEFYKLDPREDPQRAMTLNHAFYKLTKKSKQFYLLGPNIQSIPNGFPERFRCQFIRTDYATVVTELIPVKPKRGEEMVALLDLCGKINGPTLIFCASPSKARKIVELLSTELHIELAGMPAAADWVGENYHPDWTYVKGLKNGIGMHHGKMPRALAQISVKGFNDGTLSFLVCTSTLIEGVNTKAKNVIIFDNKIATKKYDFFTFNNIRGRSGRMFKHFIGNVYLFHEPPQENLPFVEVPVFSQDFHNTSESLLIQMDDADLAVESRKRLSPYREQTHLSLEVLRQNAGLEPEAQIRLANFLLENESIVRQLSWTGFPKYEQLQLVCELIWEYFISGTGRLGGVSSGSQLAFKLSRLRNRTFKELIQLEIDNGSDADAAVENVLEFLRQWPQFRFARLAMGISRIHNSISDKINRKDYKSEYGFYVGQVENMFSDPALVALDEYGLPFPLAKKLELLLAANGSLDSALANLANISPKKLQLTQFEMDLIFEVQESI